MGVTIGEARGRVKRFPLAEVFSKHHSIERDAIERAKILAIRRRAIVRTRTIDDAPSVTGAHTHSTL